jgi:hypothetical protein
LVSAFVSMTVDGMVLPCQRVTERVITPESEVAPAAAYACRMTPWLVAAVTVGMCAW